MFTAFFGEFASDRNRRIGFAQPPEFIQVYNQRMVKAVGLGRLVVWIPGNPRK